MVNLVNVSVQRSPVHSSVGPVVPCILQYEKDSDLEGHLVHAGERDRGGEADVLAHGVEEPDLGEFDGEMREEDEESALPLLPGCRDFVLKVSLVPKTNHVDFQRAYLLDLELLEIWNQIDNDPGQRTPKVDGFVHNKRHDSGGQYIVLHKRVPCKPELLRVIEGNIVLGDLLEGAPVCVLRHWREKGGGGIPDHDVSNVPVRQDRGTHILALQ